VIEFTEGVKRFLPYDRKQYVSLAKWYGVSFQLYDEREKIGTKQFVEDYKLLFKNLIFKLDNSSLWIVNHDDKDLDWFPNNENNLTSLRALFKQNNSSNTFRGALMFLRRTIC
jgi:hypothetical protein